MTFQKFKEEVASEAKKASGRLRVSTHFTKKTELCRQLEISYPAIINLKINDSFKKLFSACAMYIRPESTDFNYMVNRSDFQQLISIAKLCNSPHIFLYQTTSKHLVGLILPQNFRTDLEQILIQLLGGAQSKIPEEKRKELEVFNPKMFTEEGNKQAQYVVTAPSSDAMQTGIIYLPAYTGKDGYVRIPFKDSKTLEKLYKILCLTENAFFIKNDDVLCIKDPAIHSTERQEEKRGDSISVDSFVFGQGYIPLQIDLNFFRKEYCAYYKTIQAFFCNKDVQLPNPIVEHIVDYHDCNDQEDCSQEKPKIV